MGVGCARGVQMSYQYALKEYRAKVALEREIERQQFEHELLMQKAEAMRDQSDWSVGLESFCM